MLAEERYHVIINELENNFSVKTADLCTKMQVSRETIRRDLEELEKQGYVMRIHGGAKKVETDHRPSSYVPFDERQVENLSDKEAVARLAATLIKPNHCIALDSGTTSLLLAKEIASLGYPVTVVTNSLAIANELVNANQITLVLTGGIYNGEERAFISDLSTLIFSKINIDLFFLTTCGISVEKGITYQRMDEVNTQLAMMQAATETIVIADSSKIGVNSLVSMCSIQEVGRMITDTHISEEQLQQFKAAGVTVLVAQEEGVLHE